jgi:hypothetical protein
VEMGVAMARMGVIILLVLHFVQEKG